MRKLKWILTCAAFAVLAAVAINGTFANDVTPKPEIDQIVMQRTEVGDELTGYQDGNLLLPARYDTLIRAEKELVWGESKAAYQLWDESIENVADHFVFVKNGYTATEENVGNYQGQAYVRTWFAFEQGELSQEEFLSLMMLNRNESDWTWEVVSSGVEIEGNTYLIMLASYKANDGVLEAGDTTAPSLLQVMLNKDTTTEHIERMDGDKDGKYDILVYTQAVSDKEAWSAAFGNDHPWQN